MNAIAPDTTGALHANILEHSEHEYSGYLVFDATPNRFEFVVADARVGVLQSLRTLMTAPPQPPQSR